MASKATVTSVDDTASSTQLIAANPDRTGLLIANASSAILYVLLGEGTASTTNYSWSLAANGGQMDLGNYSGRAFKGAVQGIWASNSTGAAKITELE